LSERAVSIGWVSVTIDVEADRAETLADALLERGALSVDVSDAQAGGPHERAIFDEPDEPAQPHWQLNRVCALFDAGVEYQSLVRDACADAGLAQMPELVAHSVPEQDWVRATQQQFNPIQISERLWIVPSWTEPPAPHAINLRLDPGLAFGTGTHPTTWQCLHWLDKNLHEGQSVLDYGCGSGVLAIAAKRLGAGKVTGVDLDPNALRASRENARLNDVSAEFLAPDALGDAQYEVVLANILANPLRMLAPLLAARTRPHGAIVLAGILQLQGEAVRLAYAPWFDLAGSVVRDGWICMSGARRA
jgi:ribosomal protein L11 methyltransferase